MEKVYLTSDLAIYHRNLLEKLKKSSKATQEDLDMIRYSAEYFESQSRAKEAIYAPPLLPQPAPVKPAPKPVEQWSSDPLFSIPVRG